MREEIDSKPEHEEIDRKTERAKGVMPWRCEEVDIFHEMMRVNPLRKRKRAQRMLWGLLALALAGLILTSPRIMNSHSRQAAPSVPPVSAAQPAVLTIAIVDYVKGETDRWLEQEVVPAFLKSHPGIRAVNFIWLDWSTYDEVVHGYFTRGAGPDIINFGSEYSSSYGGQLATLDMAGWTGWLQYDAVLRQAVTWDGQVKGLPWLVAPRAYICRKDLMADGALPRTFREAVEQARADTRYAGSAIQQAGMWNTRSLADWQEYLSLLWASGGAIYDAQGAPLLDSAASKHALAFMAERHQAVLQDPAITPLDSGDRRLLESGRAACVWGSLWDAPATDSPLWEQIELSAGPTSQDAQPVVQTYTDWLGIPSYSPNQQAAFEFLKFLGSRENQNAYSQAFGSLPARHDALFGYADNAPMRRMAALMREHGVAFADVRESASLRDIFDAEFARYAAGAQDLETTARHMQQRYGAALGEAGWLP